MILIIQLRFGGAQLIDDLMAEAASDKNENFCRMSSISTEILLNLVAPFITISKRYLPILIVNKLCNFYENLETG